MPLFFKGIIKCKWLWLLLLLCLITPGESRAGAEKVFLEFIYVNANTGEAAGGHSAIKLGPAVFHYQFFPGGNFLLVRDSWNHFTSLYTEINNRTLSRRRLPLSPQVFYRLQAHFTRLLMSQQDDLLKLSNAESGLQLLEQLNCFTGQIQLPVAGLFDNLSAANPDMALLKRELEKELGPSGIQDKLQQIRQNARELFAALENTGGISRLTKLREILLRQYFLQLVVQEASLAKDTIIAFSGDRELGSGELKKMAEFKQFLLASILRLFLSERSLQAESLLLQTARYLAVSRSITQRRLCTLDPFSSAAILRVVTKGEESQELLQQLQRISLQAQASFFQVMSRQELAYARLESSRGRLQELRDAVLQGRLVRTEPGILLPSRSGSVSVNWLIPGSQRLFTESAEVKEQLAAVVTRIQSKLGYDLLKRNCATELLKNITTAFVNQYEGRKALGGWLMPDQGLVFIPAGLQARVGEEFPVLEEELLLSRRLKMLEMLFRQKNDMFVWLKESNVLSSTLYSPRMQDSAFLFFTDDVVVVRPLLGLANVVWAALYGAGGLFTLQEDQGERIRQGIRGIFYSLPELVFSNIRKGTYSFASGRTTGP